MTQNLARNGRYIMSGECAASGFSYRMEYEKFHNHRKKAILGHTPMGRYGRPDELVGAVLWLASEASSFVTGLRLRLTAGLPL